MLINIRFNTYLAARTTVPPACQTIVQHGQWPSTIDNTLAPCYNRKNDLAVVDSCLTLGRRVIIPKGFWMQLLEELHSNNLGMSRMKSLARSYLWWPQLNIEIKALLIMPSGRSGCYWWQCHPSSNGLAKNMVKSLKQALSKASTSESI